MKIIIAAIAAATALSAIAVAPASAQPYDHHEWGRHGGYDHDRGEHRGYGHDWGRHRGWERRGWGYHHRYPVCVIRHHQRICR